MRILLSAFAVLTLVTLTSCDPDHSIGSRIDPNLVFNFDKTPEQEAIDAIDEILFVSDYPVPVNGSKSVLAKSAADTLFVSGSNIGSVGILITERHQTVKGYPLISKSISYGLASGATYVRTDKYVSYSDFLNNIPADTRETSVVGEADGTIRTVSIHNEQETTYTFRSPIETVNGNKTTRRYGNDEGKVVTESLQNATLVSTRLIYGRSNGATVARTEYPDNSWIQTENLGLADGTIRRTTSSGTN